MREIHGHKVRGLTRKEIRELKEFGFYHSVYVPPVHDPDKIDEGIEKVLSLCVKDLPDEISNKLYIKLFREGVIPETYGSEDEEKNFLPSGNGSQTESAQNTAENA